jgi:hypothetical protein
VSLHPSAPSSRREEPDRKINLSERVRRALIVAAVVGAVIGVAVALWPNGRPPSASLERGPVRATNGHGQVDVLMDCRATPWWQDRLDCTPVQLPPTRGKR